MNMTLLKLKKADNILIMYVQLLIQRTSGLVLCDFANCLRIKLIYEV